MTKETLPRTQRVSTAVKNYGVGRSTLFRWIKEGRLTAIRPSARVTLLKTDELEKLFIGLNNERC